MPEASSDIARDWQRSGRQDIGREHSSRRRSPARENGRPGYRDVPVFSSRRRHTSCSRDWSSDLCSSDLVRRIGLVLAAFFALPFVTSSLAAALISGAFGLGHRRGFAFTAGIAGLALLFFGFVAFGRAVRRDRKSVV